MADDPDDLRSELARAIAHALALADEVGDLMVGCHLSSAQDALEWSTPPGKRGPTH